MNQETKTSTTRSEATSKRYSLDVLPSQWTGGHRSSGKQMTFAYSGLDYFVYLHSSCRRYDVLLSSVTDTHIITDWLMVEKFDIHVSGGSEAAAIDLDRIEPPTINEYGPQQPPSLPCETTTDIRCAGTGLHRAVLGTDVDCGHLVGYDNQFEAPSGNLEDAIDSPPHMSASTVFPTSNAVRVTSPRGCGTRFNAATTMSRPHLDFDPDSRTFSIDHNSSAASSPHSHPPTSTVAVDPLEDIDDGDDHMYYNDSDSCDVLSLQGSSPGSVWSVPSSPRVYGEA